jgi:hypothetical protein
MQISGFNGFQPSPPPHRLQKKVFFAISSVCLRGCAPERFKDFTHVRYLKSLIIVNMVNMNIVAPRIRAARASSYTRI